MHIHTFSSGIADSEIKNRVRVKRVHIGSLFLKFIYFFVFFFSKYFTLKLCDQEYELRNETTTTKTTSIIVLLLIQ